MVLPDVGLSFGWLLIIGGAILLLVEVHSPGFFATVPATVMILLGILQVAGVDISNPWMGGILGVIVAIGAAVFTVWMYGRITTDESPTTISRDSLVGMEGVVKSPVDATTIAGKVLLGIHGMERTGNSPVHLCREKSESCQFGRSTYCC